jgi:hypothetical protein
MMRKGRLEPEAVVFETSFNDHSVRIFDIHHSLLLKSTDGQKADLLAV